MSLVANPKVTFEYEVLETYEAGVELLGTEVKSLRQNKGSLSGSYVNLVNGELYLLGAHIPPFQPKNADATFDPYRSRKLLLSKKEVVHLASKLKEKGLTVVALSLYTKAKRIKAQVALVRGKKLFDKRESIKKRDLDRIEKRGLRD